jgi:hypothetical protein
MSDPYTVPSAPITNLNNLGSIDPSYAELHQGSLEGLLKDVYLPGLTDTVFNDPTFTALIQSTSDQIDYEGQRIVRMFKTQRGGGVGSFSEGGDWVAPVLMKGAPGEETIKYCNAYFELTGPAIKAARSARGSFVNAVNQSFEDTMINAKNEMERQLMGNGDARIVTIEGTAANTKAAISVGGSSLSGSIKLNSTTENTTFAGAFFPTQFLRKGLVVNISLPASPQTPITGFEAMTVVEWDTYGVTLSNGSGTEALTADTEYILTLYKAYGYANTTGGIANVADQSLEINGMQNLVDDSAAVWGRSTRPDFMKSVVEDLGGTAELTEDKLLVYLMNLQYQFQADPNLLLVSPKAVLEYFTEFEANRRFNTFDAMEMVGGYKGMGIQLGTKKLMLTSVGSMPSDHAYMMNTGDFAFASMTNGYEWVNQGGGQVLTQKETSDGKFATAVNYLNFICNDPYKQMKIKGIQNGTYNS